MPEAAMRSIALHRHDALVAMEAAVSAWGVVRLTSPQLGAYSERAATHGWRLQVEFSDRIRRLDLLVDHEFPRSPPRLALVDRPPFLTWAHIENDGVLCLLHGASAVDPYGPVKVLQLLLGEASELIDDLVAGRRQKDFQDEFLSYWDWSKTPSALPVYSLLNAEGPSRYVRVWRGRNFYLLGESDEALHRWLSAAVTVKRQASFEFDPAILVWRGEPLTPLEYPRSGFQLAATVGAAEGEMVATLAAKKPERLVVAIGSPSPHGACWAAVTLRAPAAPPRGGGPRPDLLEAGFRPGRTPAGLIINRFYSGAKVMRSSVERVDAAWIHGRDQDPRQPALAGAKVTVLGCGSVGAAVAVMLAQAGVGRLRLVDHDILRAANIGRHPLGAKCLGQSKALALALHLRERFPHLQIEGVGKRWQQLKPEFGLFEQSDLIISAIGDWAAEGALNAAHLEFGGGAPILYGWTEAHAVAGQAVLIGGKDQCLQCGMDALGAPLLPVASWPAAEGQLRQEPACGAVYQPYGPTELSSTIGLISELALDSLLGAAVAGEHRIWATGIRRLTAVGATWSSAFQAEAPDRPMGAFVHERIWESRASCPACQARAAAA
jgi:hypothetical protein